MMDVDVEAGREPDASIRLRKSRNSVAAVSACCASTPTRRNTPRRSARALANNEVVTTIRTDIGVASRPAAGIARRPSSFRAEPALRGRAPGSCRPLFSSTLRTRRPVLGVGDKSQRPTLDREQPVSDEDAWIARKLEPTPSDPAAWYELRPVACARCRLVCENPVTASHAPARSTSVSAFVGVERSVRSGDRRQSDRPSIVRGRLGRYLIQQPFDAILQDTGAPTTCPRCARERPVQPPPALTGSNASSPNSPTRMLRRGVRTLIASTRCRRILLLVIDTRSIRTPGTIRRVGPPVRIDSSLKRSPPEGRTASHNETNFRFQMTRSPTINRIQILAAASLTRAR